jgi:hypothetical protein
VAVVDGYFLWVTVSHCSCAIVDGYATLSVLGDVAGDVVGEVVFYD